MGNFRPLTEPVLEALPRYRAFASVAQIHKSVAALKGDPRFTVRVIGKSEGGVPIHHVKFGRGKVKALFSAFPHPNEPIGGLTVLALMELLKRGHKEILATDVEWHFLPCPDPDGAALNEGWHTKKFTFGRYLRHYFRPPHSRQIEWSFPARYKRLRFNSPMRGTRALMKVLREVRPDFYFSLHNSMFGGAYFFIAKDPGPGRAKMYALMKRLGIPIHQGEPELDYIKEYSQAMYHEVRIKGLYDRYAKSVPNPEDSLHGGAASFDYLRRFKDAQTLVHETAFMKHPKSSDTRPSKDNRRHLTLKTAASQKFLASLVLAHWDKTKSMLNKAGALYPSVRDHMERDRTGLTVLDRNVLVSPDYNRPSTGSERLDTHLLWYLQLCHFHQFVRLLKSSRQSAAVKAAIREIDGEIRSQFKSIDKAIDLGAFRTIDVNSLVKAQLGSGLIVLDELLRRNH